MHWYILEYIIILMLLPLYYFSLICALLLLLFSLFFFPSVISIIFFIISYQRKNNSECYEICKIAFDSSNAFINSRRYTLMLKLRVVFKIIININVYSERELYHYEKKCSWKAILIRTALKSLNFKILSTLNVY